MKDKFKNEESVNIINCIIITNSREMYYIMDRKVQVTAILIKILTVSHYHIYGVDSMFIYYLK